MNLFKQPTTEHLQKERVNAIFSLLKSEFEHGLFEKKVPNTEHEQVQMANALIEKLRNNLRTEISNCINKEKEAHENAERINLALENLK